MASKKDKLLESAQRYVLKGQIDKAIKEYQQVVALDPREIRFKQRLAELLVRDNRKGEAITQYEDIGKHYAENSYFLKAIAVYKQIQRLDSGNPDVAFTIATLNRKQGLIGNALAEYSNAAGLLERDGDLAKALKVLQEMLELEGEHSAIRFKVAELLFRVGKLDEAYAAYSDLLKRLTAAGDGAGAQKVAQRIAELFPGKAQHQLDLVSARLEQGDLDGARAELQRLLHDNSGNAEIWLLLCDVLRRQGDLEEVQRSLERMRVLFPHDVAVHREAVRLEIASGAAERALELIELHLEEFIAAGEYTAAEELLSALPEQYRGDGRVETALRQVYEASGDWEKVNRLHGAAHPAAPFAAPSAVPFVAPAADLGAVDAEPHLPGWEDIELDFDEAPEEEIPAVLEAAAAAAPVPVGDLELEWPDEPDPFAEEETASADEAQTGPGEMPWEKEESAQDEGGELPWPEESPGHGAEAEAALDAEPAELPWSEELAEPSAPSPAEEQLSDFPVVADEQEPFVAEAEETPEELAPELFSWQELFPEFAAAEGGELDLDEAESHYDLGIAYMEMGRPEAALKELQAASLNRRRRLDCLILQAICRRDNGEEVAAEELLQKGRRVAGLTPQERNTVTYELAALYERRGAVEQAIPLYREVTEADPAFRDAAERLCSLAGAEPPEIIELDLEES